MQRLAGLLGMIVTVAGCAPRFGTPEAASGSIGEVALANAGFEELSRAAPAGWSPHFGGQIRSDAEVFRGGERSIRFTQGFGHNWTQQRIGIDDESALGNEIWLSAMARADDPELVTVTLVVQGFAEAYSAPHPGDGQWHELRVGCLVPPYWPGDSVTARLMVAAGTTRPVWFDDVRVELRSPPIQ